MQGLEWSKRGFDCSLVWLSASHQVNSYKESTMKRFARVKVVTDPLHTTALLFGCGPSLSETGLEARSGVYILRSGRRLIDKHVHQFAQAIH